MKKLFKHTLLLGVALVTLHSCFKSTVGYTYFNLAVYEQRTSDAAFKPSSNIDSYAFYVDTTEWYIASWEDAVAHRITNKISGETMDEPASLGEFNSSEPYQTSIVVNEPVSMLVVVNPELKIYAYRKYELPDNLEEVFAKLYLAAWKPSHPSSGWMVVNRFYSTNDEDEAPENVTE